MRKPIPPPADSPRKQRRGFTRFYILQAMGDFGSAATTNSFEPFNADIFKDKTQQDLNESKDSDEGFSSSFSPTSESSIMQEQAIATSLHLWGNNKEVNK